MLNKKNPEACAYMGKTFQLEFDDSIIAGVADKNICKNVLGDSFCSSVRLFDRLNLRFACSAVLVSERRIGHLPWVTPRALVRSCGAVNCNMQKIGLNHSYLLPLIYVGPWH